MRLPKVAWILIIVTTIGGLFAFSKQTGWLPFENGLLSQVADERLFVPGIGSSLKIEDARKLYTESLNAFDDGDYGFASLSKVYPGLDELIALHIAEAKSEQSNELGAQSALKNTLKQRPDSLLAAVLQYRLAQSHYRASEYKKAKLAFERLARKHSGSPYAIGSLYFLGLIELKQSEPDQNKVVGYWRKYLSNCPDCMYSADIAERLDPMIAAPSAADHALLGKGYASGERENEKALAHLKKAPLQDVWVPLGKTLLRSGYRTEAVEAVIKGLPFATSRQQADDAIDQILLKACTSCTATLKEVDAMKVPMAGDYILWKLAQADSANASGYYRQIVSRYPSGDYAPESSWNLIWPLLKAGNASEFLAKSQTHLTKYGYSRSAPKTLFWVGKVLEKTDRQEAKHTYERVLKNYPNDYYAYRAWGRLEYLKTGDDPGWKTRVAHPHYPPKTQWEQMRDVISIVPARTAFLKIHATEGLRAHQAAEELQKIGAVDDLRLLTQEVFGKTPAAVESWALHHEGDKMRALRTIRDDIANRNMPQSPSEVKIEERQDYPTPELPSADELKLLYPPYYADVIAKEARRQKIDPFIAQSLMREESYFNELAVSSSNALGLMQLLPSTAREVAGWEGVGGFNQTMLFDPAVNIRLGTRYLAYLYKTFSDKKTPEMPMVGAYNGGPNAMKRWIAASPYFESDPDMFVELIPYEQTRDYIKKVYGSYWNYNRLYTPNEGNQGLR